MTTAPLQSVSCRYLYDALDRSITWMPDRQAGLQRFFCKDRLATEIQNAAQRSIFQHDDQVLAQQNRWGAKVDTTLLATDHQRSVLNAVDSIQTHRIAYTPYGHRPLAGGLLSLLGFNGERPDLVTGHYHLGNGYRQFNPVLMRFNSPDELSPFGKGGVNAYAYCGNDPLNWTDPTGNMKLFGIKFSLGKRNLSSRQAEHMASNLTNDDWTLKLGKDRIISQGNTPSKTEDILKYTPKAKLKIATAMKPHSERILADLATTKKAIIKGQGTSSNLNKTQKNQRINAINNKIEEGNNIFTHSQSDHESFKAFERKLERDIANHVYFIRSSNNLLKNQP